MFPPSDPLSIRAKLDALCPPDRGSVGMRLSFGPLIYLDEKLYRIPMVHHGNIQEVDDEGITLAMGSCADPHKLRGPLDVPLVPPSLPAQGPHFSSGFKLRAPHSAIIEAWMDLAPEPRVNLWLRAAVVFTGNRWELLPFLWPPRSEARPR